MHVKHISPSLMMPHELKLSTSNQPVTISGIIRAARGIRTQKAYAKELEIGQDLLCKYEKGRINPPAAIIERCMRELHIAEQRKPPSAADLARRVRDELQPVEAEPARVAISQLLDVLASGRRLMTHAQRS